MGKVMAVANQKGGVGKTTTVINLGFALAEYGKKVLLVDNDPQGNTTSGVSEERNLKPSLYEALVYEISTRDVIYPLRNGDRSVRDNIDLIPSNLDLAGAEIELVSTFLRELRLKRVLDSITNEYDYVLIDCPPSLGLLTVNALSASQYILIPLQCEYYALEGISQLLKSIELVKKNLNPHLDVLGVLLTMYNRTILAQQVLEDARRFFKDKVFNTVIPRNVRLSEAPSFSKSILEYADNSSGAIAYRELAKELIMIEQ
ncbi:MAG: ParA family protein [bacterium]